jgi:hypothetical protein
MVHVIRSPQLNTLKARLRSAALCHCALAAALALAGTFVSPASAQMSERQIMKMLGPMMQDPNFNEELEEFADENNLDPNMLRALMASRGKGGTKMLKQMQQQQMQQQQQQPEWMQR